jgi:Cu/Ag efflux pump CusA
MIPLSTISDFWSPLAFAIMFGLTFAMILTLVLVPTLYYRHELKKYNKAHNIIEAVPKTSTIRNLWEWFWFIAGFMWLINLIRK